MAEPTHGARYSDLQAENAALRAEVEYIKSSAGLQLFLECEHCGGKVDARGPFCKYETLRADLAAAVELLRKLNITIYLTRKTRSAKSGTTSPLSWGE